MDFIVDLAGGEEIISLEQLEVTKMRINTQTWIRVLPDMWFYKKGNTHILSDSFINNTVMKLGKYYQLNKYLPVQNQQ